LSDQVSFIDKNETNNIQKTNVNEKINDINISSDTIQDKEDINSKEQITLNTVVNEEEIKTAIVDKMQAMSQQLENIQNTTTLIQIDSETNNKLDSLVEQSKLFTEQLNQAKTIINQEINTNKNESALILNQPIENKNATLEISTNSRNASNNKIEMVDLNQNNDQDNQMCDVVEIAKNESEIDQTKIITNVNNDNSKDMSDDKTNEQNVNINENENLITILEIKSNLKSQTEVDQIKNNPDSCQNNLSGNL